MSQTKMAKFLAESFLTLLSTQPVGAGWLDSSVNFRAEHSKTYLRDHCDYDDNQIIAYSGCAAPLALAW